MVWLPTGPTNVAPGLDLVDGFAGHTPGLQAARLESNGRKAYYIGDALHQTIQFGHPEWSPIFDWDGVQGGASRRKLLDRVAEEEALLLSPHLPFPGVGRVLRQGAAFEFSAVDLEAKGEAAGRL